MKSKIKNIKFLFCFSETHESISLNEKQEKQNVKGIFQIIILLLMQI